MKDLIQKLGVATASAALLLGAVGPALAATVTINITGNGSSSASSTNVTDNDTETTTLNNTGNSDNTLTTEAETGNNTTDNNTGGAVALTTGKGTADAQLNSAGHSNLSDSSASSMPTYDVTTSGNGTSSINDVFATSRRTRTRTLLNTGNRTNTLTTRGRTWANSNSGNTGGTVTVITGDGSATSNVTDVGHTNSSL